MPWDKYFLYKDWTYGNFQNCSLNIFELYNHCLHASDTVASLAPILYFSTEKIPCFIQSDKPLKNASFQQLLSFPHLSHLPPFYPHWLNVSLSDLNCPFVKDGSPHRPVGLELIFRSKQSNFQQRQVQLPEAFSPSHANKTNASLPYTRLSYSTPAAK